MSITEGSVFNSREELRKNLKIISSQEGFKFVTAKSGGRRYLVVCKDKDKTGCKWRLYAKADSVIDRWVVKSFQNEHTCNHEVPKERLVGKDEIKDLIRHQVFKDPSCSARKLINDLEKMFDGKISYHSCFRAKEECLKEIYGTSRGIFAYLKKFFTVLESKNPGTVTEFSDSHHCFTRCFMALGCSINAMRFLRPIIGVYRMDMQSSFKGVMICAVGFDSLGSLIPLAYSYMESESNANWRHFFTSFKNAFQNVLPPLESITFISERKSAIVESIDNIFSTSHHGLCLAYLIEALENQLQGSNVGNLVLKLAASKRESEYVYNLEEIRSTSQLAYDYLIKLDKGIFVDCFFSGKRFGIYSSVVRDSAESRNYVQKDITPFLCFESLVRKVGELFFRRKQEYSSLNSILPPSLDEKCRADLEFCRKNFKIHQMGQSLFDMVGSSKNYVVDLNNNTCSCCYFQDHLFPCVHSSMPIFASGKNFEDFISPYYYSSSLMSTYEGGVIMVARDDCGVDEHALNVPFSLTIKSEFTDFEHKPLAITNVQTSNPLALVSATNQTNGQVLSKAIKIESSVQTSTMHHPVSVPVNSDISPISNTVKSIAFQSPMHPVLPAINNQSPLIIRSENSSFSNSSLKSGSEFSPDLITKASLLSPPVTAYSYSIPSPSPSTTASFPIPIPVHIPLTSPSLSASASSPAPSPHNPATVSASAMASESVSHPEPVVPVSVPTSEPHPNTVLSIKEITAPVSSSSPSAFNPAPVEAEEIQKDENTISPLRENDSHPTNQDSSLLSSSNTTPVLISVPITTSNYGFLPQNETESNSETVLNTVTESMNEQQNSDSLNHGLASESAPVSEPTKSSGMDLKEAEKGSLHDVLVNFAAGIPSLGPNLNYLTTSEQVSALASSAIGNSVSLPVSVTVNESVFYSSHNAVNGSSQLDEKDASMEKEKEKEVNSIETNAMSMVKASETQQDENGGGKMFLSVGNVGLKIENEEEGKGLNSEEESNILSSDEHSPPLNSDIHLIKGLVFSSVKGRKRELRCSKCNTAGHNKRSCTN